MSSLPRRACAAVQTLLHSCCQTDKVNVKPCSHSLLYQVVVAHACVCVCVVVVGGVILTSTLVSVLMSMRLTGRYSPRCNSTVTVGGLCCSPRVWSISPVRQPFRYSWMYHHSLSCTSGTMLTGLSRTTLQVGGFAFWTCRSRR